MLLKIITKTIFYDWKPYEPYCETPFDPKGVFVEDNEKMLYFKCQSSSSCSSKKVPWQQESYLKRALCKKNHWLVWSNWLICSAGQVVEVTNDDTRITVQTKFFFFACAHIFKLSVNLCNKNLFHLSFVSFPPVSVQIVNTLGSEV